MARQGRLAVLRIDGIATSRVLADRAPAGVTPFSAISAMMRSAAASSAWKLWRAGAVAQKPKRVSSTAVPPYQAPAEAGDLLVGDKSPVKARGRAAAQDLSQKVEGLGLIALRQAVGGRTPVALQHGLFDALVGQGHPPVGALARLLRRRRTGGSARRATRP